MLGRGLSKEAEFTLDLSPSVRAKFKNNSQDKALAILALKNKKLEKTDPNRSFKSKLKNQTPDSKEKIRKRVAACMDDSEEENDSLASNVSKKLRKDSSDGSPKRPKTVMVFGKEVQVEELERAKKAKSRNHHLVEEAELDATDIYFDKLEKREAMEEKMLSVTEMKVRGRATFYSSP